MSKTDAEYMRTYRARKKAETEPIITSYVSDHIPCQREISDLRAEVKHLKAELAKRPTEHGMFVTHTEYAPGFNSRPFTPAPKVKPHR